MIRPLHLYMTEQLTAHWTLISIFEEETLSKGGRLLSRFDKRRCHFLPSAEVLCLLYLCVSLSTGDASVISVKPIYRSEAYSVWPDRVVEDGVTSRAVSRSEIVNDDASAPQTAGKKWVLETDLSGYPQTLSNYPLLDALYNMSLEELTKNMRADGAFNAGEKWEGVWTRDVSYSTILSLGVIRPDAAKVSLLHKVNLDRIVQDTGTGGSWPVSSDRVTWALAAWEIYLVTGDREWLQHSYNVIRNSILDDQEVLISPTTGLAGGESTFLDWREQTYPRWMQPADIYSSEALGTNAVYYKTYRILAAMAHLLGQRSDDWSGRADRIQAALNEYFWIESKGYYGQYLYGRTWQTLSPRAEALGEALTILFDISNPERQDRMLASQPFLAYGVPTVFPNTAGEPPYHNRSVWPFVQAFWNLAAAKRQNGTALVYGMASIYRAAALFKTNKENFVSDTGSSVGTVINSDRQLWSVAGNLAITYRILFGMGFEEDGLHLNPVVPEELKGLRQLTNFHYRKMILDIEVRGFGGHVKACAVDGRLTLPIIPPTLTGRHTVVIEMDDRALQTSKLNFVADTTAPETPELSLKDQALTWRPIENATHYSIVRDGKWLADTTDTHFTFPFASSSTQYQVQAIGVRGTASFLSEPVLTGMPAGSISVTGFAHGQSDFFLTLDSRGTDNGPLTGQIPKSGYYVLTFRYANGSGPVNTDKKCAIRTLFVDGRKVGPIVMPQRGLDAWSDWGESSEQTVLLDKGKHRFELRLEPYDRNMDGEINKALIQSMSFTPVDR
jgi:hypothetical protein